MPDRALILTYHAIEPGPAPLCIDPDLFAEHLDCVQACGARTVTVAEIAESLETGDLTEPTVAITFDDAFASVAEIAAPLLIERGMVATVFCVAGYLGATNDWPTQPAGAPRRRLAATGQLAQLAREGFEIGGHGVEHAPLSNASLGEARREIVEGRAMLERALDVPVTTFAYPYGARPRPAVMGLVHHEYTSACTTKLSLAKAGSDPFALPRVDAHYVRTPLLLRRALRGSLEHYLHARRATARARRVIQHDHAPARRPGIDRR
jgi:peptidoglycan/xylan/chitin deacetylase (PgdA/CDA1 family)